MKITYLITAAAAVIIMPELLAEAPEGTPAPQPISESVTTARDVLVSEPATRFVESFPHVAAPRPNTLYLAQATAPAGVPAPPPAPEAAAIAEWANGVAMATTERALGGIFGPRVRKPLIVSTSERDVKTMAQMEEDLNVMMRILEKSASPGDEAKAMGIDVLSFGSSSSPKVMYVDGYGALFFLRVKYPLMVSTKPDLEQTNAPSSSEWEKARQEVYGTRGGAEKNYREMGAEPFDAHKVEELKTQLIDDLANAANMRNLKAEDSVTVVVTGGTVGARGFGVVRQGPRGGSTKSGGQYYEEHGAKAADTTTTMTLRIKKSDVDALAKGKMMTEEFKKKVAVAVY